MSGHCVTHRLEMISHILPLAKTYSYSMPNVPGQVLIKMARENLRATQVAETAIMKYRIANGLPL